MSTHYSSEKEDSSRDSYTEYLRNEARKAAQDKQYNFGTTGCAGPIWTIILISLLSFGVFCIRDSPSDTTSAVKFDRRGEYIRICVDPLRPGTQSSSPLGSFTRVEDKLCEDSDANAESSRPYSWDPHRWSYIKLGEEQDADVLRIPAIGESRISQALNHQETMPSWGVFYSGVPSTGGSFKDCAYKAQKHIVLGYTSKTLTTYSGGKESYDKRKK